MNYNNLIIFDLDGVLINSREVHYESLNDALIELNILPISKEEHLSVYDGLPTTKKLNLLSKNKGVPTELHNKIWELKQEKTIKIFNKLKEDVELISIFKSLKENNYKIAVASNSIRNTVKIILLKLGLLEFIDYYIANEDVQKSKPYPEMYWQCMMKLNAIPATTKIVEDSHIGRQGAIDSGATLVPVTSREDVNVDLLKDLLNINKRKIQIPWRDKKMNVLIPMAGEGSRFAKMGYTFPKPLIEVNGKPMIQVVVENLNIEANYIFIVRKEHYDKYNLQYLLNLIAPDCKIILVDSLTEGAACTALLAKEIINNNEPLLMANSDQFIEWSSNECLYAFSADGIDAGILTFNSTHPKWSYAKLDDNGFVSEVAEKKVISDIATVGIYYWSKGSDFVKYAEQMIEKNIRVNNEFYVCPAFNEAISDGKKIRIKNIEKMWGIGTPEDLDYFLKNYKGEV
ncbi:MAG: HAD family hydrolase [Caulobacteraceae bacterium]|nr:HAD family hydrolase [Caulobacteraceae bacterium]